jgi:hypothetical protein
MQTPMRHRKISTALSSSRDHLAADRRVHSQHAVVIIWHTLISLQTIDQTEAEGALTKIERCDESLLRALTLAQPATRKKGTPDTTQRSASLLNVRTDLAAV